MTPFGKLMLGAVLAAAATPALATEEVGHPAGPLPIRQLPAGVGPSR